MNDSKLSAGGVFGMTLVYDQQDGSYYNGAGNTVYHNGKLSAVKWMSKDGSGNNTNERSYTYQYDQLGRINAANYSERAAGSTGNFNLNVGGFDESGITYDEGGNIMSLNRNSNGTSIDQLTYNYTGARLNSITDASGNAAGVIAGSGSYGYDPNGNITTDPYKGITSQFNILNRLGSVVITGQGTINYTYDASGTLLKKQKYNTTGTLLLTTDYIDGFEYEGGNLNYFPMPEGRILNSAGTLKTEYIMGDQQGNARVSFDNSGTNGTAQVKQENSYYAFGMTFQSLTPSTPNINLYNGGSEWQRDFGDNLPGYYQTFNRNYDPAIGRFISVDSKAESVESMSSYNYAMNNPVMFNDPLGDKVPLAGSKNGGYFGQDNLSSDPEWFTMLQAHMQADAAEADADFAAEMAAGGGSGGGGSGTSGNAYSNASAAVQAAGGAHITDPAKISQVYNSIINGTYSIGTNTNGTTSFSYSVITVTSYNETELAGITGIVGYGNKVLSATVNGTLGANQGGTRPSDQWFTTHGWEKAPWYGNFLGPGPDGNPYFKTGPNGSFLRPIDMLDAAAQQHDYWYDTIHAGGLRGALFDDRVYQADLQLAYAANRIIDMQSQNLNDTITGKPISVMELAWAYRVTGAFTQLGTIKKFGMWLTGK